MSDFRFEFWPTEYRHINQLFGVNQRYYSQFNLPGHEGIDIQAPLGSRIFSVAPGRVKSVRTNPENHNYGIHVRVQHDQGFETIYAHLQELTVGLNDLVDAGSLLGLAGSTGNSTGPHLHLTLKQAGASHQGFPNNIVDPSQFLLPLLGWQEPAGPFTEGWAFTQAILALDRLAQANAGGVSLRSAPARGATRISIVPEGTIMIVTGGRSGEYTPVRVSSAAIGLPSPPPVPEPPPPASVATVDGWGFAANLFVSGEQAVVGDFGINLRAGPVRTETNVGLVSAGSTVQVLGPVRGEYLPVRVARSSLMGPVNLPDPPPELPEEGDVLPADTYLGWGATAFLAATGTRARVTAELGINLRAGPAMNAPVAGIVKGFATVTIAGVAQGDFTPVLANKDDVLNPNPSVGNITTPQPLPRDLPDTPPPQPVHDTTPGWAFTAGITVTGAEAIAGPYGINLRAEPRRNALLKGFVPSDSSMIVTGPAQGEYTPVRVDDDIIQLVESGRTPPLEVPAADPPLVGQARIGLHASADPGDLRDDEHGEFSVARPGIIKVLSAHSGDSIARLAAENPEASWIVRAFLSFRGGRVISPDQFLNDTINDVERALSRLQGRSVVIEIHNEPNLSDEGLDSTWANGTEFGSWWLDVLRRYRQRLPGQQFIYPGLSPGPSAQDGPRRKEDHQQFIESSRQAVEAADGLGIHLYWARNYAMSRSLATLDDYIRRFPRTPIWVTEASNNKGGVGASQKGRQYLTFWAELKKRPAVRGVTYFVASASDLSFAEEVWVGRGIGAIVGQR